MTQISRYHSIHRTAAFVGDVDGRGRPSIDRDRFVDFLKLNGSSSRINKATLSFSLSPSLLSGARIQARFREIARSWDSHFTRDKNDDRRARARASTKEKCTERLRTWTLHRVAARLITFAVTSLIIELLTRDY